MGTYHRNGFWLVDSPRHWWSPLWQRLDSTCRLLRFSYLFWTETNRFWYFWKPIGVQVYFLFLLNISPKQIHPYIPSVCLGRYHFLNTILKKTMEKSTIGLFYDKEICNQNNMCWQNWLAVKNNPIIILSFGEVINDHVLSISYC